MAANKFVLKHRSIEIDYTPGVTPGLTVLTYKKGSKTESFKSSEITVDKTALGELVSVPLELATKPGASGEVFGFYLPLVDVPMGKTAKFSTVGVYERIGPPAPPPDVRESWSSIELHGTAQTVMIPMEEAVPV